MKNVDDARMEFLRELADVQISAIEATIAAAAAQIAVLGKKLTDALSSHAAACNESDTLRIQLMQLDADNAALVATLRAQQEVHRGRP
jgi:RNase adaptor protein for sRNA GlmZ degradation